MISLSQDGNFDVSEGFVPQQIFIECPLGAKFLLSDGDMAVKKIGVILSFESLSPAGHSTGNWKSDLC